MSTLRWTGKSGLISFLFFWVINKTYCSFLGLVLMSPSTVMSEKSILNLLSRVAILHRDKKKTTNEMKGKNPSREECWDKITESSWKTELTVLNNSVKAGSAGFSWTSVECCMYFLLCTGVITFKGDKCWVLIKVFFYSCTYFSAIVVSLVPHGTLTVALLTAEVWSSSLSAVAGSRSVWTESSPKPSAYSQRTGKTANWFSEEVQRGVHRYVFFSTSQSTQEAE